MTNTAIEKQLDPRLEILSGTALGMFNGIDEEAYRTSPYVSQSCLKAIKRSPAHWKHGEHKETDCMRRGTIVDIAITESEKLSMYHPVPDRVRRNTKEWNGYQAEAGNKLLVKQKEMDDALRMAESVMSQSTVRQILDGSVFQPSLFGVINELSCKGRPDIATQSMNCLADIKTTTDARRHSFQNKIKDFGYHIQCAFYIDLWQLCEGFRIDGFVFIVVEDKPPYAIKLYELPDRAIQKGRDEYTKLLDVYQECNRTSQWPGYENLIDEVDLPNWYYYKEDDES